MRARAPERYESTEEGGPVSEQAVNASSAPDATEQANAVVLALLVSFAIVLALATAVFWPARSWTPPRRPGLSPPIVFDEFVNAPNPSPAPSSGPSGN